MPLLLRLSSLLLGPAALALADIAPYVVPPTLQWDGADGQWSTFQFELGSPFQQVRLLPATSGSTIAPIINSACQDNSQSCQTSRGQTFDPSGSSSWTNIGNYSYTSPTNLNGFAFGDRADGLYGLDNVRLAWPGPNAPQVNGTAVALLNGDTLSFYQIGQFGLTNHATNLSSLGRTYDTIITQLYNSSMIPSMSFGYTAGAHNRDPPAFGSLVLGGVDLSKHRPSGVSFPFPRDGGDIVPSLQRITLDGAGTSLLPTAIPINIDSQLSQIVLPVEACRLWERAFNLTYSADQGFYFVSDALHASLQRMNPSVTFTLGPSLAGGQTVPITLPYSAFDLAFTPPIVQSGSMRYFPLQRAANSSQYVLGRTFLQHAYLTVDWERQNYSISPALFAGNAPEQLQTIASLNPKQTSSGSSGLSGGAIAGIVIGVLAALAIIAGLVAFAILRRRKQRAANAHPPYHSGAAGAATTTTGDASSGFSPASPDMSTVSPSQNFSGTEHPYWSTTFAKAELGGDAKVAPAEAPTDSRAEMDAPDKSAAYGLRGDPKFAELEEQQRHEIGAGKTDMMFELDAGDVPAPTASTGAAPTAAGAKEAESKAAGKGSSS